MGSTAFVKINFVPVILSRKKRKKSDVLPSRPAKRNLSLKNNKRTRRGKKYGWEEREEEQKKYKQLLPKDVQQTLLTPSHLLLEHRVGCCLRTEHFDIRINNCLFQFGVLNKCC